MKVTLETKSNGIHSLIDVSVQNPKTESLDLIKQILVLVEAYNKEQIETA